MIELKELCAGYGKREILHSVCASFARGRVTAIIGPNGSGKSTLLKAVAALLPAKGGRISVDGRDLASMKPKERAKRIAYLSQGKETPDMTVGQMVLHGRFSHVFYPRVYSEEDKEIAREAMLRMGLSGLADRELSELSGGMRQNAYIAMALAQSSDYILLDEPTTYLDIANRLQLMSTLRGLAAEDKGVVAVLHDLPMAMEFADEIAVVREGHLLAQEGPEELFASGLIDRVFGVELKRSETEEGYAYYFGHENGGL